MYIRLIRKLKSNSNIFIKNFLINYLLYELIYFNNYNLLN